MESFGLKTVQNDWFTFAELRFFVVKAVCHSNAGLVNLSQSLQRATSFGILIVRSNRGFEEKTICFFRVGAVRGKMPEDMPTAAKEIKKNTQL